MSPTGKLWARTLEADQPSMKSEFAQVAAEGDPVLPSLQVSQFATFHLDDYETVHLSLASDESIAPKDQNSELLIQRGRLTVQDHFAKVFDEAKRRGHPISTHAPILAVSCRNVMANPRCGAWIKGVTPAFLAPGNEDPAKSRRPYHFLGFRNGRFVLDEMFLSSHSLTRYDWILTGVPVYWDGEQIHNRMLAEISDFSHVYQLPRGSDPHATPQTVERWRQLRSLAAECLYASRDETMDRITEATRGLLPENNYLHHCAGVTADGKLLIMAAHGALEKIGARLASMGAERVLVLDNGGSCSIFYFPGDTRQPVPLFAALNFRPFGTAYLFGVLRNSYYRSFSAL